MPDERNTSSSAGNSLGDRLANIIAETAVKSGNVAPVVPAAASAIGAEWHIIHAGQELGPMLLAELVEKAVAGEVEADDLVKKTSGPWTKARDFAFLQREFVLKASRERAVNQLGRFHGVWISRKYLAICGCILAALVGLVWNFTKSINTDSAEIKPMPRFSAGAPPTWEDVAPQFQGLFPDLDPVSIRKTYEEERKLALERSDWDFAVRLAKNLFPDVTVAKKTNSSGILVGRVHNGTEITIKRLKLSIKSAKWERVYEEQIWVTKNTTAGFSIFVGDALLEVESFKVLSAAAR